MSKHSRSTATPYAVDKRSRIQSWLMQEGWKIAEGIHPNASWVINASQNSGFTLVVIQPSNLRDQVVIQAGVNIDDNAQKLLVAMEGAQRRALLWELRFDLLKMGVDFGGFEDPPKHLTVTQRMYDDGLTKDRFLQRVTKIKNAQVLIIWTLQRSFDQTPDDDILGAGVVH